jgi:hypothetical protein
MDNVAEKLDNINKTLEKILSVMNKPKNKFVQWLNVAALIAGAFAIIHVIETILNLAGG